MAEKTQQQLLEEIESLRNALELEKRLKGEREVSNNMYARKIVETGFVGLLVIFALASLYYIFARAGIPHP